MIEKMMGVEKRVEKSKQNAVKCFSRVSDLERNKRGWTLRHYGLAEKEDVCAEVINICQKGLPPEREREAS